MAYTTQDKLHLGNVPLPADDKAAKYINSTADEIDSIIGFKYVTPVVATGPNQRPVRLLLDNLNSWLASGRLGLALTASTQQLEVHAYFRSLIEQALAVLYKIRDGEIVLDGAQLVNSDAAVETGPLISNLDSESNVEAHYNRVTNPLADVNSPTILAPSSYRWVEGWY